MNRVQAIKELADFTLHPNLVTKKRPSPSRSKGNSRFSIFPDVKLSNQLQGDDTVDFISVFISSYIKHTTDELNVPYKSTFENDNDILLYCSLLLTTHKKSIHTQNSTRINFVIGVLLRQTDLFQKALSYLLKSLQVDNIAQILHDIHFPPTDPIHHRKMERMSANKRNEYLSNRARQFEVLLASETAHRHLRTRITHYYLFYYALITFANNMNTHSSFSLLHHDPLAYLDECLSTCSSLERVVVLRRAYFALKHHMAIINSKLSFQYSSSHYGVLSSYSTLDYSSIGDTHTLQRLGKHVHPALSSRLMAVIDELITSDADKDNHADYVRTKGILRALCSDICESQELLQEYQSMVSPQDTLLDRFKYAPASSANLAEKASIVTELKNLTEKRVLGTFAVGGEYDDKMRRRRDDFAVFGGCHQESTTVIILPPILGWQASIN